MSIKTKLWVDKYRPSTIDDYVWRDEKQMNQVKTWIADKTIPNLLLSGSAGVGKTSLIGVILNEIGVSSSDVLYTNASKETSIDTVRERIVAFASTIAWGDLKVVVIEEADGMSLSAQQSLKCVIEDYSEHTRFIFTTNNPHKIIDPILSRLQTIHVTSLDKESFIVKLATILVNENIDADVDTLDTYVAAAYPDLRKAINTIQLNCVDGKLMPPSKQVGSSTENLAIMVDMFKSGNITAAREFICKNISYTDYPDVYRFLYNNLTLWGKGEQQYEDALICIRNGIVNDSMVADREINLAATLVQLRRIKDLQQ